MINQLLNAMYHLNIKIKEKNNRIKLIYDPGLIDENLKAQIKKHKAEIIRLLKENEAAIQIGFLVYAQGQLLEYRYGRGAYLFIERHFNGLATVWRENYREGEQRAYKVKIMAKNVSFERAFEQAAGFVNWLQKQRKRAG
ncbi:hypothetical protein J9303_13825 [Bacillaceae bacterium Marseille-Q3522]|nr:hypothetical protein [Bacillaceae bacterium Marseille-Q3522]